MPKGQADLVFEACLSDAEKQFGYDRLVVKHASLSILDKYKFVINLGTEHKSGTIDTNEFAQDHDISKTGAKALLDGKATGLLQVKVEHVELQRLKEQVRFNVSAKDGLGKLLTKGEDLLFRLEVSRTKNKEAEAIFVHHETKVVDLRGFITDLRGKIMAWEDLDKDSLDDELIAAASQASKSFECAKAHDTGFKLLLKEMQKNT